MPAPPPESEQDSAGPLDNGRGGRADRGPGGNGGTSRLEWALAAAGAALVLAAVGSLLYEGLGEPDTPPVVVVTVRSVRPAGAGHLVEFEAENRGQETAAGVGIEGTLRRSGAAVETSRVTLDYVPSESSRRGGLYFVEDPGDYEVEVRATGYGRP